MAKKKKRYSKRRKPRRAINTSICDNHHILWQRKRWGYGALGELRRFHYCIVPIPKNALHKYIHSCISQIPVPKESSAKGALTQLRMLDKAGVLHDYDPIEKRIKVLIALFDCIEQPTADALKKQLEIIHEYKNNPS